MLVKDRTAIIVDYSGNKAEDSGSSIRTNERLPANPTFDGVVSQKLRGRDRKLQFSDRQSQILDG